MAETIFVELSFIFLAAVVVLAITSLLRQPLIIGYIITGVVVGPTLFDLVQSIEILTIFSQIGIAVLLFMVGLGLNPKVIKEVGGPAILTGVGQVAFTFLFGYLIAKTFGFTTTVALYIAIALSFSSTIIIMKLLSDKKDLDKLYGKISVGFLIIQDLIAVFILMAVSSLSGNTSDSLSQFVALTSLKGALLIFAIFAFAHWILPHITKRVAKSQEFLLLFSLGWCFIIATTFELMNFSIEIGALIAGVSLSMSPYRHEISSKLRPIRDFFIFLFFIWLGMQMTFTNIGQHVPAIIAFSTLVLIGNPLIVMTILRIMKYKKSVGFKSGLTVAQISEFSLILIALGIKVGHLTQEILSILTIVAAITITGSTYFIMYSEKMYRKLSKHLKIFESNESSLETYNENTHYEIILFGYHRTGAKLLKKIKDLKKTFVIIDYNPKMIAELNKLGVPAIYGDAGDSEFLNELGIDNAKIVISTIPNSTTNIMIRDKLKRIGSRAAFIATAERSTTALELYKEGVDYVLIPQHLGGDYAAYLLEKYGTERSKFKARGESHRKDLKEQQKNQ